MKIKYALAVGLACTSFGALPLAGCGDDDDAATPTADAAVPDTNRPPIDSSPGDTSVPDTSPPPRVPVTAKGTSNGSSVALSPDESRVVMANRDKGSVTVFSVVYGGATPVLAKLVEIDVGTGSEPWQVTIDPLGDRAYVVLRQAQKLVRINGLNTAAPTKGAEVQVGSEPTGIALSPKGTKAYVANWVDGTVSGVDTETMTVTKTFDLNAALIAAPGSLLGAGLTTRPGLAHPRSIAVTNNLDTNETDETLYVTEYFAQRTAPETASAAAADTNKQGLVYRVKLSDETVSTVALPSLANMGFNATPGTAAGCFPNQVQSITLNGKFAYVTSVCASPRQPLGVRATAVDCPSADTTGNNVCIADVSGLITNPAESVCAFAAAPVSAFKCHDTASVKTSTAPLLSVFDTSLASPTVVNTNLNRSFLDRYDVKQPSVNDATRRMPLLANDLTFVPGGTIGYVSANGTNAVFRLVFDANGALTTVGADTPLRNFIDLTLGAAADFGNAAHGLLPTGLVAGSKGAMFVANDVSRNLSVIDLATQTVAGAGTPVVVASSAKDAAETAKLKGKLFFNTGLGRWSLRGQGWGACQSCHTDGLTDNVTWIFGRGPRQSTSLDGSFDATGNVQRIFNWTAVFDDIADFEGNTRGTSGGVGAIVNATTAPIGAGQRIDLATVVAAQSHLDLNGSSKLVADAKVDQFALGAGVKSAIDDWFDIEAYVKGIRSPRGARGLDATKVAAGRVLFQGSCAGCHSGPLWTTSELFYTRTAGDAFTKTTALTNADWTVALFPTNISPTNATTGKMRGNLNAGGDSLICGLRRVGTFDVAEANVGVTEIRANGTTAQGADGYSPPSLLGVAVGGPYLHAGNARTLESLFSETFANHHRAISANFLLPANGAAINDANRIEMIQFLLSIEDATMKFDHVTPGAGGGKLCQ